MISSLLLLLTRSVPADTAASNFAPKWNGAHGASAIIAFMASHNLIFVVLGVSLIIWFVLLFFIIRTDRKITKLERKVFNKRTETNSYVTHET